MSDVIDTQVGEQICTEKSYNEANRDQMVKLYNETEKAMETLLTSQDKFGNVSKQLSNQINQYKHELDLISRIIGELS